jgi:hypothetical protein
MIRLFDWSSEDGPNFGASTTNGDESSVDCYCIGNPMRAESWDVGACKKKNPELDEVALQNAIAQMFIINMLGPYRVFIKDMNWAGGITEIGQGSSLEDNSGTKIEGEHLGDSFQYEFWGDR